MERVANATKHIRNYLVSQAAARSWSRGSLNTVYNRLNGAQREGFHREFSKVFRNSSLRPSNGTWEVLFAGEKICVPLTSEKFWLDWDTALSVVGQDMAVRETYEALIRSPERPELFIDIGTNYGTHSLLFLVHQIDTFSFEPNSSCREYFRRLCAANQVTPNLEPVALGERSGSVTLLYPRRETWLGTVNVDVAQKLVVNDELVREEVEQRTLDGYMEQIGYRRTLIKIDTEGHELPVLRGAAKVMQEMRPYVIFECWNDAQRADLFALLASRDYQICRLPWSPFASAQVLTLDQFLASSAVNFIAVPLVAESERHA